ncbi:uncharacterized protein LOC117171142 [Belonocnema kinseyi]|uniref:uncharacterized protein LOC117171142 n=1 Tax=Belonocnema kinseyi TaxID=2817044 RepID=UPI00143CE62B|nr:uncharacterized protein LOC117171142 [Belonocnema kinseyi]
MLETISLQTKTWIFWPPQESVKRNIPLAFHMYPSCRCMIDSTVLRTETPPSVEQRVLMYSSYKGSHTIKYLIAVTPDGYICKISKGYGGRTTDSFITNDSGFLKLTEPGEQVLADKGFPQIKSEVHKRKATLLIPPVASNPQFTNEEVDESCNIASVRIHAERAIQRIKLSRILSPIPVHLFPHIDEIMQVCSIIANIQRPLINERWTNDSLLDSQIDD